jgi:hypothetical protein
MNEETLFLSLSNEFLLFMMINMERYNAIKIRIDRARPFFRLQHCRKNIVEKRK